jgi:predicted transcriptional regulator
MKYRSKTDIIGHILESVNSATVVGDGDNNNNGLTISKIMYTAFLSYPQLKEYLSLLLEKGLIEKYQKGLQEEKETEDKEKQQPSYYYRITDKGRRFLQLYRDLSEMIMIAYR